MKHTFSMSRFATASLIVASIIFASCKKDSNSSTPAADPTLSVEATQNNLMAENQFEDVFNISMGVQASDAGADIGLGTGGNIVYRSSNNERDMSTETDRCFTVTVEPQGDEFPKTVTLDFGAGCKGFDGKTRSGKIITVFTGPMRIAGSKATATFENYNVDSFAVEGSVTIENTSSSNNLAWTAKVTDGKITNTESGYWVKWDAEHERIQTEGNGTPFNLLDNVYQITGSSVGSNSNGHSWTTEITKPITRKFICAWRDAGQITVSSESDSFTAILDYGDGICDNKATVTVNGKIYNIELH